MTLHHACTASCEARREPLPCSNASCRSCAAMPSNIPSGDAFPAPRGLPGLALPARPACGGDDSTSAPPACRCSPRTSPAAAGFAAGPATCVPCAHDARTTTAGRGLPAQLHIDVHSHLSSGCMYESPFGKSLPASALPAAGAAAAALGTAERHRASEATAPPPPPHRKRPP